jgi:hypothetical protein
MANPDTVEKMKAAGFEPAYRRVPNWASLVNDDIARMKKVADSPQIKVESWTSSRCPPSSCAI